MKIQDADKPEYIYLTVIMGSKGPKISSFIIAASSGGSTKTVGSINLH